MAAEPASVLSDFSQRARARSLSTLFVVFGGSYVPTGRLKSSANKSNFIWVGMIDDMSFNGRVVVSFLLVPWLPVLFFVPYSPSSGRFRLFGWDNFHNHILLCSILAAFTYLLELVILIPIWRSMRRSGRTSLLRFATIGFLTALASSIVVISLLAGPDFVYDWEFGALVPLFSVIGCAEAVLFWLIVRPDRYLQTQGVQVKEN